MAKIFISYRRNDRVANAVVGFIYRKLENHYGEGSIFLDVDQVPPGVNFQTHLNEQVQQCDVVLILIGDTDAWLGREDEGNFRIKLKDDWVRIEVEGALSREIPVVPVLLDGAKIPRQEDLPPELADLPRRNAEMVSTGRDFEPHLERLMHDLDTWHLKGQRPKPPPIEGSAEQGSAGEVASASRATPARSGSGGCAKFMMGCGAVLLVLVLLVGGGAAWYFLGPAGSYAAPSRSAPAVTQRMAGTLTEFPVDTNAQDPMVPAQVHSQEFATATEGSVQIPAETLPPGLSQNELPRLASTVTTASYSNSTGGEKVHVHVLTPRPGRESADDFARRVVSSSGGNMQRTEVTTPSGQRYSGYSVQTVEILIYIVFAPSTGNIVIVYAPTQGSIAPARRLAGNIGNGRGLLDYPAVVGPFQALPSAPPSGYVVTNLTTMNVIKMQQAFNEIEVSIEGGGADVQKLFQTIKVIAPASFAAVDYSNPTGNEIGLLVGMYDSPRASLTAWRLLSLLLRAAMQIVEVNGVRGMVAEQTDGAWVIYRKGPFISVTWDESGDRALVMEMANQVQL